MKNILLLTKVLYKNSLGMNSNNKSTKSSALGKTILLLIIFGYVFGVFGFLSYEIINVLIDLRQEQVFISFALLLICGFTLFRTILTAINILYFSKDVEFLLPLPISPIKIVFAKFNVMLISNIISEFLIFGVPFIIYAYLLKLSPLFCLSSALVFLVLPIIPMLIASIVIVLIMSITNIFRNKDLVQYISVVITIAFVIGVQFLSSSSTQTSEFVMANKIVEINGYSSVVTKYFITIKQGSEAILNNEISIALKNMGLLYLESIGLYIIIVLLISKLYLRSALKVTSSGIRARKFKLNDSKRKNIGLTYISKEFKALFRTPVYLMQCVLPSFLFPIIFSIPIYQELRKGGNLTADLSEIRNVLGELLSSSFGLGIILSGITLLYMFNYMSVTAISREGENALFMKYIPINLSKQYKYKAIPGIIINLVPLVYVLTLLKLLLPTIELIIFIEIILLSILCNILINYLSVLIDLRNPKLHWTTEYAVVKQNINMLYEFILSLAIIGTILGISSYISNSSVLSIVLATVMILVLIIFEVFLRKFENKIFSKIS